MKMRWIACGCAPAHCDQHGSAAEREIVSLGQLPDFEPEQLEKSRMHLPVRLRAFRRLVLLEGAKVTVNQAGGLGLGQAGGEPQAADFRRSGMFDFFHFYA